MFLTEHVTTVFELTFCCFFPFSKQQMACQWWWVHIFPIATKLSSTELKFHGKVFHVLAFKLPRASRDILLFRYMIFGV